MKKVKVYVEGGGSTQFTRDPLRDGFDIFCHDLKLLAYNNDCELTFILCGGKTETIRDFKKALISNNDAIKVLLVDSDGPVTQQPKKHLKIKIPEVTDDQCHLMVQIMESWFLADLNALRGFYIDELDDKELNKYQDINNVENIDKKDIEQVLIQATKETSYGNYWEYGKTLHASKILKRLNANTVRKKAKHCDRLFTTLETLIASM